MRELSWKRAVALASLLLAATVNGCSGCSGCKGTDPDPIVMPDAEPPSDAGVVDLVVPPEDAGGDADADADAKPATGGGENIGNLRACCNALQANAASAPPPQNVWMGAAAQYCSATAASINSPTQKDAMLASLRKMLRGGALPGACK